MDIGWVNGNQEMKGFWRTRMYVGEENVSVVREIMRELGSFTLPAAKVSIWYENVNTTK